MKFLMMKHIIFFLKKKKKEGYAVVKLDIDTSILKKARTEIRKIAKFEENSGDSCFCENRIKKREILLHQRKNCSEYGIF